MRPLAIGVAVSAVLAGPPLYALVEQGGMTGTDAIFRGLVVAGFCTLGASFLDGIIGDFRKDAKERAQGKVVHHPSSGPGNDQDPPPQP